MPRAEAGSLKALANKQKSIGLQKLRWYCQLCQKQCRDENGFKCHTQSEGHLRQMKLFAENSHGIIDDFSKDFCKGYLEILSHRHGNTRVQANKVYQEYIAFKEHVHMNATMWTTLTEFCIYLGKEGKAVVEEDPEKGWYVQYIDRDPQVLARQAAFESKQKAELDDEERAWRMIQTQIHVAERLKRERESGGSEFAAPHEEGAADSTSVIKDVKVELSLGSAGGAAAAGGELKKRKVLESTVMRDEDDTPSAGGGGGGGRGGGASSSTVVGVLEQLKRQDDARKAEIASTREKLDRREDWLHPNIVVRVMNKKLADGRFYKLKGTVVKVIDRFIGEVQVDGALVRVDQADLETVLPKVGAQLVIVNGRGRGSKATLLRINEDNFNCDVRIVEEGTTLNGVEYEDVCKLAV